MWSAVITILASVLEIVKQWLTWQVALTKIRVRTLAYDIDAKEQQKGRDLLAKIDAARTAGDLVVTAQLLDDAAANALYVANVRSAVPVVSGLNVGGSGGIPATPTPGGGVDSSPKPTPGSITDSSGAVIAAHLIPKAPYSVTGLFTWFGINPDGSNDSGDVDDKGKNLTGAFGDDNHRKDIVGLSIPIPIFHATIGSGTSTYADVRKRRYLFDIWSHTTGKHVTGVWLTDLGPSAGLNRPGDMTYALGMMLGLKDNSICSWSCTDTQTGKVLAIKGYDYATGKVET